MDLLLPLLLQGAAKMTQQIKLGNAGKFLHRILFGGVLWINVLFLLEITLAYVAYTQLALGQTNNRRHFVNVTLRSNTNIAKFTDKNIVFSYFRFPSSASYDTLLIAALSPVHTGIRRL